MNEGSGLSRLSGETGVIARDDLESSPGFPAAADLRRGPIVVIECSEEIPCNPCETVCHRGAIVVGEPITNLPRFEPGECNACGICVAICPGLAIFVVDLTYSETEAAVSFPHEYLPLPEKGDAAAAVNRRGEAVCKATVIRVRNPGSYDHTPVITITVPSDYANEVRAIRPSGRAPREPCAAT